MFKLDQFLEDCKAAAEESSAQKALHEIVKRAVSNPEQIIAELGEPEAAGLNTLYQSSNLTVLNLVWGPEMFLHAHDHQMMAVIGIYGGKEENTFYRRSDEGLKTHGSKLLETGETAPLGRDIIHSVRNPILKLTAALHVYTGDFFEEPRSEWNMETLEEKPFSVENTRAIFEQSNNRLAELKSQGVVH